MRFILGLIAVLSFFDISVEGMEPYRLDSFQDIHGVVQLYDVSYNHTLSLHANIFVVFVSPNW
jgi:hypothetical protein